jgi:hypothetical protein
VAVETRVLPSVEDVGAEVALDYIGIGYLLRAVVRTTAVAIVAGGRLASALKTEVGRAGIAVDKDRRLKLDGAAISKVLVNQLINDGLLHPCCTRWSQSGTNPRR